MRTAEDTVRRIGVSRRPRTSVDEPGAVGIRPEPGGGDLAALRRANPPGAGDGG